MTSAIHAPPGPVATLRAQRAGKLGKFSAASMTDVPRGFGLGDTNDPKQSVSNPDHQSGWDFVTPDS